MLSLSQNFAPFLSYHQLIANENYWKEHRSGFQCFPVFAALSQFSRAEHFLHCRPFPPKPRGSSRHKGILGLSNQNLRLLRTFVGQKRSKKHEQSAALQNLSALDHEHDLISHHYQAKTAHIVVAGQMKVKGHTKSICLKLSSSRDLSLAFSDSCPYQRVPSQN